MKINRDLPIRQVLIDFISETQTRAREDRELMAYLQGAYNPNTDANPDNLIIRAVMSYIELIANQIGRTDRSRASGTTIDRMTNPPPLTRIVVVEEWTIHAAISGWGIIRCPYCNKILRPLETMPPCSDGYVTHDLQDFSGST